MDGDLGAQLKEVLNDPEMMRKIRGLAAKLGADGPADPPKREEEGETRQPPLPKPKDDQDRIRLLSALLPYLNEERREAARAMIRILRIWDLIDLNAIFGG